MIARVCSTSLVGAALVASLSCATGCGAPPAKAPPAPEAPKPATSASVSDDKSGFAQKDFGVYRSARLGLSIPLPDRAQWTVEDRADRNSGWLVATHPPTSTTLRVRTFDETTLVGRLECEMRARLVGELPKEQLVDAGKYQTLVDEPLHRPKGWDARRWVAFEPRTGGALAGHVYLMAGRAHTCLVVHAETTVPSDTHAEALADRLELLASRSVGAVTVDTAELPELPMPEPPKGGP